ncbi:MAG: nitrate reductase molybdenum cofactor assembly chaperone [Dehalococcoidia bacterium]|nr:nitrate reductase molybdenum cofactor assembly chaperone [Dehalococcoidia bacterium]
MADNVTKRLFQLLADVLEYPSESLLESTKECIELLAGRNPEATGEMKAFLIFAESIGLDELEETYTRTFDMAPTSNIYAGFFLFGESHKRGLFLVGLEEAYRKHGFSSGTELADHLGVVLRFLGVAEDPEFVNPLFGECILPMLEAMEVDFKASENGYKHAMRSIRSFLRQESRELVALGGF